MDRADFRQLTIIETYAQLTRFVQRKQMTLVEAAKLAISMGDALTNAMTIDAPDEESRNDLKACHRCGGYSAVRPWNDSHQMICDVCRKQVTQDDSAKGDK